MVFRSAGSYSDGGTDAGTGGQKLTIDFKESYFTPNHVLLSSYFNDQKKCGYSDWANGVEKKVAESMSNCSDLTPIATNYKSDQMLIKVQDKTMTIDNEHILEKQ